MGVEPWQRRGLLASGIWVVASSTLAFWDQTWISAWRLYCYIITDPACFDSTVFVVVHGRGIAVLVLLPLLVAWLVAWALQHRMGRSGRGV